MATKGARRERSTPARVFRQAIDEADYLQWCEGLQAIPRREGRRRITARDRSKLLGSVNIDQNCRDAGVSQSENRWDFVIGYGRESKAAAFFVEVHSAISREVSRMERKWRWLRDFLQRDANAKLRKLTCEYHWVASGKVDIPKHLPQYKRLARLKAQGLCGPKQHLELS